MGLDKAIARAFRSLQRVAGKNVVYRIGDQSVALVAVPGSRRHSRASRQALSLLEESSDWLFLASELVIGETPVTPKRGHRIEVNGATAVFEVLPADEQCFRLEQNLVVMRVHSKQVQE